MNNWILLLLVSICYAACPVFQRTQGTGFYTTKQAVPMPIMTVDMNVTTMMFKFSVQSLYLREDSTYVIDFTPFNPSRSIASANNCENRAASSYVGVSNQRDFWKSAVNATVSSALNTKSYLAYGPANGWTLSAVACDAIKYERSFSFSQLTSCSDSTGKGLVVERKVTGTNLIEYEGAMYVTLVNPIWNGNVVSGYETIEYRYPFLFKFGSLVNDVVSISAENNFNFRVLNVKIDPNGRLVTVIRTELKSETGDFLHSPTIMFSSFKAKIKENMTFVESSCKRDKDDNEKQDDENKRDDEDEREDSDDEYYFKTRTYCVMQTGICYQEWIMVSLKPYRTSYVSDIDIRWIIADCSAFNTCNKNRADPTYVRGTFKIAIDMVEKKVGQADFKTKLSTYNQLSMTNPTSGPFGAGDRVYVKDELSLGLADVERFSIVINNAWICFPETTSYIPRYNPAQNMFGCSKVVPGQLPSSNIVQLVKNQRVSPSNPVENLFDTRLYASKTLPALPYVSTVAFSFSAQTLTMNDALYYIHVETLVKNGTNTRIVHKIMQQDPATTVENNQGGVSTFYVTANPVVAATNDPTSSGSNTDKYIAAGVAGFFALLGVMLVCVGICTTYCACRYYKRKQMKRLSTDSTLSSVSVEGIVETSVENSTNGEEKQQPSPSL